MRDPDLERERALWASGRTRVAGVDEVGVGPLAGPVVAAACLLPPGCEPIPGVRDSKLLPAAARERLLGGILEQAVAVGLGAASVREVERLNVVWAARLAMRRALLKLGRVGPLDHALVDGRPRRGDELGLPGLLAPGGMTAVVDGDVRCYAIACASVVAKVTRDRLMRLLARRHPGYGWERNAGYGTREHLAALRTLGVTPHHRRTYAPVREALPAAGLANVALTPSPVGARRTGCAG